MSRLLALVCVVCSVLLFALKASGAASGVTEIPLAVRSVVYDPFTDKLYASATNNLLELDPLTGQVLDSFYLGTNVTVLSLGADHGMWAAVEGESSIRRFDLTTHTAGDRFFVGNPPVLDLYGSMTDPTLAVACFGTVPGSWSHALVIRNGLVLPDWHSFGNNFPDLSGTLLGASIYFNAGGNVYKMALGPRGIVDLGQVAGSQNGISAGMLRSLGSHIYCGGGSVLDADSLAVVGNLDAYGFVSVSPAENVVYYLTLGLNSPAISRFAHPSLQKIGTTELGDVSSIGIVSFAGYRVHAAFNTAAKLYIVDLEKAGNALPTAQLEVVQIAPPSIEFGSFFDLQVTITNHGPSIAQVIFTESISSGFAYSSLGQITPGSPIVQPPPPGLLAPGEGFTYYLSVQPSFTGPFTNTVLLATTNTQPTQVVSTLTVNVLPPPGPITSIQSFYPSDVAYDSHTGKLFAWAPDGIAAIDPQSPAFLPSVGKIGSSAGQIETSGPGGFLFVQSANGRSIQRLNTSDFTWSDFALNTGVVLDLLASPTDTNLVAVIGPAGTQLIWDGVKLANGTSDTGAAQFSADGTKLYLVNAANCVLDIFNVDQNGLTLSQTRTNATCSTFAEADGLIYFSTGLIYDPVVDQRSTFGLTPPVFVISRGNQVIDTLSRTNNSWIVQRFSGANRQVIRSIPVTGLSASAGVLQFAPAGPDRVAITCDTPFRIVNLAAPAQLVVGISLRDQATVALGIDSTAGAVYRIETVSTPGATNWTTVQDNIAGTGGIMEIPIPILAGQNAFFRAVRKSQ